MRGFIDELKSAITGLGRAPGFTALASGVLGLGLGAVIFMYGVADTLMLKPPPYPNADRLYTIVVIDGQKAGDYDNSVLPRDFEKVREVGRRNSRPSAASTSAPPTSQATARRSATTAPSPMATFST